MGLLIIEGMSRDGGGGGMKAAIPPSKELKHAVSVKLAAWKQRVNTNSK